MNPLDGFTLIELVVVMLIIGMLAGIVAVFIGRPVTGYLDIARRCVPSITPRPAASCNGTAAWVQNPNARIKLGTSRAPYIYLCERH